ncbi:oxygenase MpaB family protein [Nocardiopsis xinjiangensis]|uniref:oxygenase MpaB family protein n=1 Tax=Nocardiopsis xinjiangensis TaxID=124285 RepID=UPI000346C83E|nr:oxygenase MpaB family protein [Nocardiopsis xinjiangensis]
MTDTPARVRVPRPGEAAWRRFGDVRSLLMGPQLLLLQVAHPVVGAGVLEHSEFRQHPWRRLWRTLVSLSTVVYGGQETAVAEAARVRGEHTTIKGVDEDGRRYHALHPEAYHWVHATLVKGPVEAHRLFGPGLERAELEAYYTGLREVGRVWGLAEHHLPHDWESFLRYYDAMVHERLEHNRAVDDVVWVLAHPARPSARIPRALWEPVGVLLSRPVLLVTVGSLPPVLRERFGLHWGPVQERSLRRLATTVRAAAALTPPPLRRAHTRALAAVGRRRQRGGRW